MAKSAEERARDLSNRAYALYNTHLNKGLDYPAAQAAAAEETTARMQAFDKAFDVDEADPLRSEAEWTTRMDQFKAILKTLNEMPYV